MLNTNTINNTIYGIVFPGQGSQAVGMLYDIATHFPIVHETFEEASHALGYDLWQLVQNGPSHQLDLTIHTQPALLAASYAIWRILKTKKRIHPVVLAGHSLGEYTALVAADALSFKEAIQLVADRGRYMQEAIQPGVGAMAAILGIAEGTIATICAQVMASSKQIVSPANFNSIGQTVIAGHKEAVEEALILAKENGAKLAVLLPVSVPSHCHLMQPAALRLAKKLSAITFQSPTIPIINNVDVTYYNDAASIREGLTRQLYMPVQWVMTIQKFAQLGVTHIVECGPGKVLTGLNKRIDKQLQLANLDELLSA